MVSILEPDLVVFGLFVCFVFTLWFAVIFYAESEEEE